MPKRNGVAWKNAERDVAKAFGTERVLRQGTDAPDVRFPGVDIEVKKRKAFPGWLWDFVTQARNNARQAQWAVVLVEARRGIKTRRLAVIDFDWFVQLVADSHRYYQGDNAEDANATEDAADLLEAVIEAEEDSDE